MKYLVQGQYEHGTSTGPWSLHADSEAHARQQAEALGIRVTSIAFLPEDSVEGDETAAVHAARATPGSTAPAPTVIPTSGRSWRLMYRVAMATSLVIAVGGAGLLGAALFEEERGFASSSEVLARLLRLPVAFMYTLTLVRVASALFSQPRAPGRKPKPVVDSILGTALVGMLGLILAFLFGALYWALVGGVAPGVHYLLRSTAA